MQPGTCDITVDVKERSQDFVFGIYPNPSTGAFTIKMDVQGGVRVNVFNSIGQNSYTQQYAKWSGSESIDLSMLSSGMYLVKVENNGVFSTKKIFISK